MSHIDDIFDSYFVWLKERIRDANYNIDDYSELLEDLYATEFRWILGGDRHRLQDGIDLRTRFSEIDELEDIPCNVLEMMVALSIRCEEEIMMEPGGDNTSRWFWGMIESLGLIDMTDDEYDQYYVEDVIQDFLDRNYSYDGAGGLFTLKRPVKDVATIEIWYQACTYLNEVLEEMEEE